MKICVQCYAGHRGEEEPRAFYLNDRRREVMEISDRWLSPGQRCFKVQVYDGSSIYCAMMRRPVNGR